jgi:hypothetical protein
MFPGEILNSEHGNDDLCVSRPSAHVAAVAKNATAARFYFLMSANRNLASRWRVLIRSVQLPTSQEQISDDGV